MQLDAYLVRIGYQGPRDPTVATLVAVHRCHALGVTYENLDVHLGRRLTTDPGAAFAKIVGERRGGWCYEMNGLLAWALGELGFRVRYLSGAVGREQRGDDAEGNHLVLLVELDRPYLADVGFGDGLIEPVPLEPGSFHQGHFDFELIEGPDRWYFRKHPVGGAKGFDFTLEPRRLGDFEARCHQLQTSASSGFVRSTVCQRHGPTDLRTLRGATFRRLTHSGEEEWLVETLDEYRRVLDQEFELTPDGLDRLWPRVWARHLEWLKEQGQ